MKEAQHTGEPIIRALEYNYPHKGYQHILDEFMSGTEILVTPIVEKGISIREIVIPDGNWQGFDGKTYTGNQRISIPVTLNDLPYFIKK